MVIDDDDVSDHGRAVLVDSLEMSSTGDGDDYDNESGHDFSKPNQKMNLMTNGSDGDSDHVDSGTNRKMSSIADDDGDDGESGHDFLKQNQKMNLMTNDNEHALQLNRVTTSMNIDYVVLLVSHQFHDPLILTDSCGWCSACPMIQIGGPLIVTDLIDLRLS